MTLPKNGFIRTLIVIVVILFVLLISLNIFLNVKLDSYAAGYLEKFSEKSGFRISVDDVGVDPFFRVSFGVVTVSDPSGGNGPFAEIESVKLEPGFVASLMERRIKIGRILIEHPVIRYDKASIDKVLELLEGGGGGGGKSASVAVERVRLEDASIEISPDFTVLSGETDIVIKKAGAGGTSEITFAGDITAYDIEAEFKGSVKSQAHRTAGDLKLTLEKINRDLFPDSFNAPRDISGYSDTSFVIAGDMKFDGQIVLKSESQKIEGPVGNIKYGLSYEPSQNTAYLDTFNFRLLDAFEGTISGTVEDVTGDMTFDLSGRASTGNVKEIVKWFPDINENELSGTVGTNELRIEGSRKDGDISLKGKLDANGVNFADNGGNFKIKDMDCSLDIKQGLSGVFTSQTHGRCSLPKFFWKEIGEVDNVSGNIEIKPMGEDEQHKIVVSNLKGRYMDGAVSGTLKFGFGNDALQIGGTINGEGLDLAKAPKNIAPVDMEGNARSVSADFNGSSGDYKADISFTVGDLVIKSKTGREFRLSGAETGEPVRLEYSASGKDEAGEDSSSTHDTHTLTVKDKSLSYENLSFGEYLIKGGKVANLSFGMELGGDWNFTMSSEGRGFQVLGKEIGLDRFREHIEIPNSGRDGFTGLIDGQSGRFKGVEFPSLSAEYEYAGDSVRVQKLSAEVGTIGKFVTDNLSVRFGNGGGGYPYDTSFRDAEFTGFDGILQAREITGTFVINNPESSGREWKGDVEIGSADISSQSVTSLAFGIVPSAGDILLSDITGRFMGGDLTGRTKIVTTAPATKFVTDLSLQNAAYNSQDMEVKLGRIDANFSGTLPDGSLPEGAGKLRFSNIAVDKSGVQTLVSGSTDIRTSCETLFIDNGFIRDKDNEALKFSGEMVNTLSDNRKLHMDIPEFSIPDAIKFFRPLMPPALAGATTDGHAGLHVEIIGLFSEESGWNGDITFKNAFFKSYMGGADLSVRDINGEIRIKEQGVFENSLASLMDGDLDLDKQIYRDYERSFKEALSDGDLDLLTIGEVEYGILLFNNIECELEVDTEKINLGRLVSEFFQGKLYATGVLRFDSGDFSYNFSLLFNDVSLQGISKRLSSIKDYITGRVNGLIWLTGEGANLDTIDGPFEFWAVKSSKEPRSIGKALLDQLGAKERFILGSTRSYDKGEISGYINDGIITFKTLDISNTILGYKNLSIKTDPIRNSISISHLVSVIREISRRSKSGGPTIETN